MKRPAFQFYAGDWRGNAKLRRCTHAERGIWIEVLCLMHDSEEYGVLRWPLKDIALAVSCRLPELRSLALKDVLKGGDESIADLIYTPRHAGKDGNPVVLLPGQTGPIWFSSRMVRDEYVRSIRGEATRFVDLDPPKATPKAAPKPPIGDGSASSTSSSTSKESKALSGKPDAIEVLKFLNLKANRNYEPVRANVEMIQARLAEGFTVTQLRQVVAKKCREWLADDKMAEYLRPKTLFSRTNFANYAGELVDAAEPS